MNQAFGMYRLSYGSLIVHSSYDFDTHKIGPYTCPIDVKYNREAQQGNSVSLYKYYELFREQEDVLAIFNNGNYCFVALHTNYVTFEPFDSYDEKLRAKLPTFGLRQNLGAKVYKHIGFMKTYQECKAVYQWPWYLIQDADGNVPYVNDKVTGEVLENPPLQLYKMLIETDYNAVYFDLAQNKPVFIN